MHIKDVRVTNTGNVLIQIPAFIVRKWKLQKDDELEVSISHDERTVTVRPKKIRTGSNVDSQGEGLA